jgi:hypothetical protein
VFAFRVSVAALQYSTQKYGMKYVWIDTVSVYILVGVLGCDDPLGCGAYIDICTDISIRSQVYYQHLFYDIKIMGRESVVE